MRRVVVTGLGLVTPLACGAEENWKRLIAGESGIRGIQSFDVSDLPCKIAGQVPQGETSEGKFNADSYLAPKDQRKLDRFIIYGMAAAHQALEDAGWQPSGEEQLERTGVLAGSGIGGLETIYEGSITVKDRGPRRLSPFFIPAALINLLSGQVSIRYGFKGPNHAVVTACSTGAHAIGDASRLIALDEADVMVAGGSEAAVCRLGIAGFAASRALSTNFNDTPERASRPWDEARDGFVMGEGAGLMVIETLEHAEARGARPLAVLSGYGTSADAHHITSGPDDGAGAAAAMRAALRMAGLEPEAIGYVNAHATSTPVGDRAEIASLRNVFGDALPGVPVSSTKSAVGHLLGAAGGVESIFSALAARDDLMPPTLNLEQVDDSMADLDFVPNECREKPLQHVLCNGFGFGGVNAALIVSKA